MQRITKSCTDCAKKDVCKYREKINKIESNILAQDIPEIFNININCNYFLLEKLQITTRPH